MLIKEYNDDFELIVIEITTQNINVRVITGYGPQENPCENEKMQFWVAFEEEVASAELNARSTIVQWMPMQSWAQRILKMIPNQCQEMGRC